RNERDRMNDQFADIGHSLDQKNPEIVAPNPAADRCHETNVVVRVPVVLGEYRLPASFHMEIAVPEHRDVKVLFKPPRPGTPDIEIAIATRLEHKKKQDQDTDQNQWQWRCAR